MNYFHEAFKNTLKFLITSSYEILNIYTYIVFVGLYCIDAKEFSSFLTVLYFMIYHVLLGFSLMMYIRTESVEEYSTKDLFPPVKPPSEYDLDLGNINPMFADEIRERQNTIYKVCDICVRYKPPRSHHCSVCNKCFLKYDHHCSIFGSCIFFQKYKFFYQFLVYNLLFTLFVCGIYTSEISKGVNRKALLISYAINLGLLVVMLIYNGIMLIFHTFLILNNETTVEYYAINRYLEGDNTFNKIFQEGPITTKILREGRNVLNPYNLGYYNNWIEVFGEDIINWFLPIYTTRGDGISFNKNYADEYHI